MKKILIALVVVLGLSSCKNAAVEHYFVDNAEKEGFMAVDLPASILKVDDAISADAKKTLASIKKLNIIALKKDAVDATTFEAERLKFKALKKDKSYEELISFKNGNTNFSVKIQGETNAIDQILVFADDKEKGFGIARILGDKMNPAKIMQLKDAFGNMDLDGNQLSVLKDFLK
jgi:ERCC4-related helicase